MTCSEVSKPTNRGERRKNWADPEQPPDESQKRELIIRGLQITIKFVMNNHTYTFGNQIRKQAKVVQ